MIAARPRMHTPAAPPATTARDRYKNIEAKAHEVDVSELTMPGELLQRLRVFLVTGSNKIPVLPEIARRLLDLSNQPRVDVNRLVAEVERDGTIAGRLLATANSAFYSRGTAASSVKAAIVRLGLAETRDIVYRLVAAASIFRVPAYAENVRHVRLHSMVCAYLTRDICRRAGFDHDLAFLCGLVHDVGKVILLSAAAASSKTPPPIEDLLEILRADHNEAGALTAEYWKLPEPVVAAVREHHSQNATSPYSASVSLADRICRHLGFEGEPEPLGPADAALVQRFGFSGETLQEVCAYALAVREAVEAEEGAAQ